MTLRLFYFGLGKLGHLINPISLFPEPAEG
jgi:hypothetical protein